MERQGTRLGTSSLGNSACSDPMLLCCMCERLLEQPQQLRCLHNCCRSCLQANGASETGDRQSSNQIRTLCPICDEVSDVVKSNSYIDYRVRMHKVTIGLTVCGVCEDKNYSSESTKTWCTSCCMIICEACMLWHRSFHKTHRTVSVDEVKHLGKDSLAAEPLCAVHQKPFEALCFSCKACKCEDCWASCGEQRHEVNHLRDVVVTRHLEKVKQEVDDLALSLLKRTEALAKRKQNERDLRIAFERDLEKLKVRNRRLISAVTAACSSSEQRLAKAYDDTQRKAAVALSSSATAERKARHATEYSQYVLLACSETEILNQEAHLVTRMQSLLSQLTELEHSKERVAIDRLPTDNDDDPLIDLVTSLIAAPTSIADNNGPANNLTTKQNTGAAKDSGATASNEGDTLLLSGNSNTQVKIVVPSGALSNITPAPHGAISGSTSGSKLVMEGNESAQICMASGTAVAGLSSTSGGETIIKGNKNLQLYAESSNGSQSTGVQQQVDGSTDKARISGSAPSHRTAQKSTRTPGNVSVKKNHESQVMITRNACTDVSSGQRAEGAMTVNENNRSQVMIGMRGAQPAGAPNMAGVATTAATAQRRPQSSSTSVSSSSPTVVLMPIECSDVSLTYDGRLLLAAGTGMLECSAISGCGKEVARWQPTEQSYAPYENSWAVEALSASGKAVVGITVGCEKPVVLLRRHGDSGEVTGDRVWISLRRLVNFPSIPDCLSAHGDTLATATQLCGRVELLSISRRELLVDAHREYGVESVAITDRLIISVSETRIKLARDGRQVQVVDAHSRADGRLVWRHAVDDDVRARDVCTDTKGDAIYFAAVSGDGSDRVVALNASNGRELCKNVMPGDNDEWSPPFRLSMRRLDGEQRTILAVLCEDKRTVVIHSIC